MYRYGDRTPVGHPHTDQLPLLDLTSAQVQPNISPQFLSTTYSEIFGLNTMDYNIVVGSGSGSGSGSKGTSLVSPGDLTPTSVIPRSGSSHSLQKNTTNLNNDWFIRMGLVSKAESDSNPVRRVFSTGDLQKNYSGQHYSQAESPLSSESSSIIESMSRAYPYSPEEKKERIERYRNKRSQRNFNKKIKYECRKTLADSRPRVRGRFTRNDEIEKSSQLSDWGHECVGEDYDDDDNWVNFLDSFSTGLIP